MLIVDSGDLFIEKEDIPESFRAWTELKADLIGRIYTRTGIDALNVSETDLVLGIDFLKRMEKILDLPFVSANLTDERNNPLFKPYIIKKVSGKSVGIFGVVGDTGEIVSKVKKITRGAVGVQDAIKSAESAVNDLAGKVDLIVALTHQGVGRDWVIAKRVPGIDVIIGGRDRQKITVPREVGKTRIVQAGEKGQYLGLLQISFEPDGNKPLQNNLIPLGGNIADDTEIKSMTYEYQKQLASLHGPGEKTQEPISRSLTSCSQCHQKEFAAWKATKHARAYNALVNRGRQFDPDCLPCHTTRFEEVDGFIMKLQQEDLVHVQCESCHGQASGHATAGKPIPSVKPKKEACIKCHTADRSPSFEKEYEGHLQKIKH